MSNPNMGKYTGGLSYQEKEQLLALLEEKEKRIQTGGHLVKLFPEKGPYSWKHYPKHMDFINAGSMYKVRFFMGANRCLAKGTLVATPSGPVPIEELQEGDEVYDRNGDITHVIATWDNGERETVSLQSRNREFLRCTPDHEIDCYYNRDSAGGFENEPKQKKVEAGKLYRKTKARRVHFKAPLGDVHYEHAYSLAAMLGDGCGTCGSNLTQVISSADEKIPNKVAANLGASEPPKKQKGSYSWSIKSAFPGYHKEWCKNRLAHDKIADLDVIKTWDRESILNFVAGLIDTDGSLVKFKDGFTWGLSMQAKSVIDAFVWCVLALWQEQATVQIDNRTKYKNGPVYTAYIRNPWAIKRICEELRPYLAHDYKADTTGIEEIGNRSFDSCISIYPKDGKLEQVYDITVEHKDHMFLLANGLCVSNCGKTELGSFELCCHLTGQYPHWWTGKVFDHPIEAWGASDTSSTTRDILQFKLLGNPGEMGQGLLAADRIANVRMKSGVPDAVESVKVKHISGGYSWLGFKSYDQGRRTFQGTAKHVILLDEEPRDEGIISECVVRTMTTSGIVMITATPLMGLTPLVQSFMDEADTPNTKEDFTT